MQFQIPQFIEVEDKIVGPLTIKQFLYLAGAGGISFILFFILQGWLWIIVTVILGALAIALAFIKYNGQSLPKVMLSFFFFLWRPRLYLWKREAQEKTIEVDAPKAMPSLRKLWQDLLTTKNPIPKREKIVRSPHWGKKAKERYQLFRKITGERDIARRVDYR